MSDDNLIIIVGQEGSGKSTTVRALLADTPNSARMDAEEVGDVNPWQMDDAFIRLLHANVADLTRNFWAAGYRNVIAGSFMSNYSDYRRFRARLDRDANVSVIHLCATKPTSAEWRDRVDRADPEDGSLRDHDAEYRYLRIDNDAMSVEDVVLTVRKALPDVYRSIDVG